MERYDSIRILGEGSFGKVYLMRDKVKKSLVCIKIIKIKNIPKKEREATRVEVELLRRLHHPNIVRYVDSFLVKNNESLCICMEYCDGGDLASQIKAARRNLFSESKVLHWFVQIALGLHYMHNNKVLHRDLKTQNIFLLGNGRLVLGDLGISKVLDGTTDLAHTCIGTPYYMSPEIFKNKPYSYKSDVWALGCVLYEMTTLTHAFDANSLNGLAGKIIKGRYPPIHLKYSKQLRDLISDMLLTNPQQRPDLDQILRKSFIKKHIVNFFVDVMSRPSGSIGNGTMIVRAAVSNSAPSALTNDTNMLSLKQQLQHLDMMEAVNEALSPRAIPSDVQEVKKLAKEQLMALKREEGYKVVVEAALEKLRIERENRAKSRVPVSAPQGGGGGGGAKPPHPSRASPSIAFSKRDDVGPSPSQSPKQRESPMNTPFNGKAIGNPITPQYRAERGANAPSPLNAGAYIDNSRNGNSDISSNNVGRREAVGPIDAMGVIAREKQERDRRQAEEAKRRQLIIEQDARERADDRRREETRLEAKAREEREVRIREEVITKQRQEQIRLQAEAALRRDALRQRERERQNEEIEQLKRDKIEFDRRSQERERVRNERRIDERRRLDSAQEKPVQSPSPSPRHRPLSDNYDVRPVDRDRDYGRAEEKESVSARDRVLQRKQEKLVKEEQDRLEALREAEAANRLLRVQANQQNYNLYHANSGVSEIVTPKSNVGKGRFAFNEDESGYVFDSNRNPKSRPNMDIDELSRKLTEASAGSGKPTRYDVVNTAVTPKAMAQITPRAKVSYDNHDSDSDETASEDDDDTFWGEDHDGEEDQGGADEAILNREEELQNELQMVTLRMDELKRTLNETKTALGSKQTSAGDSNRIRRKSNARDPGQIAPLDDGEDYFEEDEDELEETQDYGEEDARPSALPTPKGGPSHQYGDGRSSRPGGFPSNGKISSYDNLQDAPAPSGRISDRISMVRQRCITALGRDAFQAAYSYLKSHQHDCETSDIYNNDADLEKISTIRGILKDKDHFTSLIEQLIFMESSD